MAKKKANKMDQELVAICDHQNIDIKALIHEIRGQQVLLDRDLAMLYGVENKRLNEQVKRNITRFPEDFMFQLNTEEMGILKSQFATSSWGGSRKSLMLLPETA